MTDATPILAARGIGRSFKGEVILRDIDLTVQVGESVSLTGASGSGKTTLLSILGLLLRPDRGSVWIDGANTAQWSETNRAQWRRLRVGCVLQTANLIGALSVLDNVLVPASLAGEGRAFRERARGLLSRLGLSERERHYPHMLSVGQRRRVAIARALLLDPPIVLADEPTNDLDPHRARQIGDFLWELPAQGHALILVTHDRSFALEADRTLVLHEGAISSGEARRSRVTAVEPSAGGTERPFLTAHA